MRSSILGKFAVLLAAPVLFFGCEEEKKSGGNLIISTQGVQQGVTLRQATAPSLVFNSGYVVVREVVFDGEKENDDIETSISFTEERITTIDMMTGVANPPFEMNIPAGTYTSVSLGIEIQDETAKPSVVATGTFTNATGAATPIRFEFNSGEVFEAESDDVSVTLFADTPVTAKISFDPHAWFSTVTIAQLNDAVRTNGVIIISETSNRAIFDIVADRLDDLTDADFQ